MSILDGTDEPGRERAGFRPALFVVLLLILLLGGGYAAAYAFAGDNVPRGTKVAGVNIGGRTHAAAVKELEAGLAERINKPIAITINDSDRATLMPADLGLSVDLEATVDEAGGGRSWDPQRLWDYYTGGDSLEPVLRVDDAKIEAAVAELNDEYGTAAKDGGVKFGVDRIRKIAPVVGASIDVEEAKRAIVAAYLDDDPTAALPLTAQAPDIDEADVDAALNEFANPAMSSPVVLRFGKAPVRLLPRDYRKALKLVPEGGALVPTVNTATLQRLVSKATSNAGAPVDATVALVNGKPKVIPAKPGVTFDPEDINSVFLELVTKPEGEREVAVPAKVDDADFTTQDARKLKIKENVGEWTTNYPDAAYRNQNIGRAAELIDGTLLMPGETFSMNDIVGERTRENGFTEGFIISNGILVEDLGGGVSQMATTTFNAMFFAGLEDIEHKPHSFYIDRYPVGREATVAWGAVDLRFRNDSPYGVLISAKVTPSTPSSQGIVTVKMFSTKVWDIKSTTSEKYNYVAPQTRTLSTPNCHANTGYSGFQVDVTRTFRKPGESEIDHVEKFHTNYIAADTVICKPPPPPPKQP